MKNGYHYSLFSRSDVGSQGWIDYCIYIYQIPEQKQLIQSIYF
jgi:hypothetical protein